MSLNARKIKQPAREPKAPSLDPGAYPARLVQVIALGLQPQHPYKGEDKPPAHEVMWTYEFLDEFMPDKDGEPDESKPRWLSENRAFYSLDNDKAISTKRYYALDPKEEHEGDWEKLLGLPCTVNIVQKPHKKFPEFPYNNIVSTSAMRAKDIKKAPELVNPPKFFDIDEPDLEIFFSLPQWVQDKITSNLEFDGSVLDLAIEAHSKKEKGVDKKEADDQVEDDKADNDDGDEW